MTSRRSPSPLPLSPRGRGVGGEGLAATPIVEVKNLNSFRAVERAVKYEAQRQYEEFQRTGKKLGEVAKATAGWDEARLSAAVAAIGGRVSDVLAQGDATAAMPLTVAEQRAAHILAAARTAPGAHAHGRIAA